MSIVTLAPIASPAASPGRSWSAASTAVSSSSGSAPASSTPTATTVTPSRRAAPAAFSTKSSAPRDEQRRRRERAAASRSRDGEALCTSSTGIDESAGRSSGDGPTPRATSSLPSAATIAPLSVHRPGRGTRTPDPGRRAALLGHGPQPRVRRHAAADDQVVHALLGAGQDRLAHQHVDDRFLEGRRDVGHRHRLAGPLTSLDPPGDGGLQAGEGEVVAVLAQVAGPVRPRGKSTKARSPSRADRSMCGPPGKGRPSTRATLSKASPAASSIVAPSGSTPPRCHR